MHSFHPAQSRPGSQLADTVGHAFYKKGADYLTNQFKKDLRQHGGIVALSGNFVKTGRFGRLTNSLRRRRVRFQSDGHYAVAIGSADP